MNWYKKAQQGLLSYPYGQHPEGVSQKVNPVSVDPETGQNIYKCHSCGELVLEENTEWYKDIEGEGENLQLPQYNKERISQALTEMAQYLSPFLQQLFNYIQENNLEEKRNDTYDYGFRSALQRWEIQVPQLQNIANNYPEFTEICSFQGPYQSFGLGTICKLLNTIEINGATLLDLEEFIRNPTKEAELLLEYSNKQFNIKYSVPVCEKCYEGFKTCNLCDKVIPPGQNKYPVTYDDEYVICEKCIEEGNADVCISCGKADSSEDMIFQEDEGYICSDCYKKGSSEKIEWAENVISNLDIPVGKNNPISGKALNNLDEFLRRYIRKYGNNYLDYKEYGKLLHMAKKSGLTSGATDYLETIGMSYNSRKDSYSHNEIIDILNDIDNSLDAQEYMKKQYPDLKNYQDIPFDIDIVESFSKRKQGFTITITPSNEFFNYAETKYPAIRSIWDKMSDTPHHNGTLAYARCAYEGGNNLVINNLQRDADFDNYISRTPHSGQISREAAKWLDTQTKQWDIFLLNLIKAIAISENISAYLTTFDQQKSKWGNLPIHKSKRIYKEVPERMGFPLEEQHDSENLMEEGGIYDAPMYQIANIKNWYKTAKIIFSRKKIMKRYKIANNNFFSGKNK